MFSCMSNEVVILVILCKFGFVLRKWLFAWLTVGQTVTPTLSCNQKMGGLNLVE